VSRPDPLLRNSSPGRRSGDARASVASPAGTLALARLRERGRAVCVGPGRTHALTPAEELVLATEPMQRLLRLRQMGLAHHGLPGAEHTRLSHSLGTAYWAVRMLEGLSPRDRVNVEGRLGPNVSLELLVRLFALVHDIALLPLGHTLRFQIGLFEPDAAFGDGLRGCLRRVAAECVGRVGADAQRRALVATLEAHLALCAAVARAPRILAGASPEPLTDAVSPADVVAALPALTFVYDVVHGVYAADLIDVCVRDMHAIGRDWELPSTLLRAGAAFVVRPGDGAWPAASEPGHGVDEIFRYGVRATRDGRVDSAVLTDLLHVHLTRFDIAEKGFYERRKCAADAMLDKCLRRLRAADGAALERALDPHGLLRMGDDELLDRLIALEHAVVGDGPRLAADLRAGWLHDEAFALEASLAPDLADVAGRLRTAAQRTAMEERIAAAVPGLGADEVIVSPLPERMQGKPADTLVGWHDGEVVPLHRLAARVGFAPAAVDLCAQYRALRRLSVLIPRGCPHAAAVAAACREALALPEGRAPAFVRVGGAA